MSGGSRCVSTQPMNSFWASESVSCIVGYESLMASFVPSHRMAAVARRRLAALLALVAVGVAVVLLLSGGSGAPKRLVPSGGTTGGDYDPLAHHSRREGDPPQRGAPGFAGGVYEKSPGGGGAPARG